MASYERTHSNNPFYCSALRSHEEPDKQQPRFTERHKSCEIVIGFLLLCAHTYTPTSFSRAISGQQPLAVQFAPVLFPKFPQQRQNLQRLLPVIPTLLWMNHMLVCVVCDPAFRFSCELSDSGCIYLAASPSFSLNALTLVAGVERGASASDTGWTDGRNNAAGVQTSRSRGAT